MNYLNNHLRKKTFGKTQPQEKTLKKATKKMQKMFLKMQKTFKEYKNCQKYKIQKRNNYLINN